MSMKKSPLAIAVGTTLFSGLTMSAANAADPTNTEGSSPFAMTELSNGYMQLAKADKEKKGNMKMKESACGEGKCGAGMMPKGALEKTAEGKCAGNKPMPNAKKDDMKGMEGKCGSNMQ